jgi:osmoprotectant transport system ATP-binding protein
MIAFRGVSYQPKGAPAPVLNGFSLEVMSGETVVLLGLSGSGKTTALRLVNRLLEPTAGEVLVEGRSTMEWDPILLRRRIGYVIQDGGLFPHFTVARNVGIVPTLKGEPLEQGRERVISLLQKVGLPPERFADRFPHELSGGQRQRVGVARALAGDPHVLLLDEPFSALDPLTRVALQREFCTLMAELGKAAIFVTHDIREALVVGTRIALLEAGQLSLLATPKEFLQARDGLARAFLDTIEMDVGT